MKKQKISTTLTTIFSMKHPIISAPMQGTSTGLLAGEVAKSGCLGLIGVGSSFHRSPEWLIEQNRIARDICGKENRVGFGWVLSACELKENDPTFIESLKLSPDAMWFSFGDYRPFIKPTKSIGAKVIVQVFTTEEALEAIEQGVDVIVLQNSDAGGHGKQSLGLSATSLITMTKKILGESIQIPIVSAGGIINGKGLASALCLGADGVVVGTRFLCSVEADRKDVVKSKLIGAKGLEATISSETYDAFRPNETWPSGVVARGLRDDLILRYHDKIQKEGYKPTKEDFAWLSEEKTKLVNGILVGTGVGQIETILNASQIVDDMISEAVSIFKTPKNFELID